MMTQHLCINVAAFLKIVWVEERENNNTAMNYITLEIMS